MLSKYRGQITHQWCVFHCKTDGGIMSNDLSTFRELVLWLWQTHEKPWDYRNEHAKFIVDSYNLAASSLFDRELEAYLPSESNVSNCFPNTRYFYLTPVTDNRIMVPRIQLKCDFGRNIPEIRCRLELFLLDNNAEVQSLGFRFESPEGKSAQTVGVHHYYHIQLIQPPTTRIDWLPETQPAFPIDADDPVKLLLGLLISLYGLNYIDTILREAYHIRNLGKYISGIRYKNFDVFEWYRIIEIGNPPRHVEGYKVISNLNEFEIFIRGKYQGCNIRSITRSEYDALDRAMRKIYP